MLLAKGVAFFVSDLRQIFTATAVHCALGAKNAYRQGPGIFTEQNGLTMSPPNPKRV